MNQLFGPDPFEKFVRHEFEGADFRRLILQLAYRAEKYSFVGSLAAAMEESHSLGEMAVLKRTKRIDGVLPLHVPQAVAVSVLTAQLLEEIAGMGHAVPDPLQPGRLGVELGLCILAVFHNRRLPVDFGMGIDLRLEAKEGDGSLTTPGGLNVTGVLPLGGKITIIYSGLDPVDCLDFKTPELIRIRALDAMRTGRDGRLRLTGLN